MKKTRSTDQGLDQGSIFNNSFNTASGSFKVSEVGHKLKPLLVAGSYTTDFTTSRKIGKGATLAFYNTTGSAAAVTIGDSAITALAVGVTNAQGSVGIPVPPNSWLYLNSYDQEYCITAAGIKSFIVEDHTSIIEN
jgi:hypothetical protein